MPFYHELVLSLEQIIEHNEILLDVYLKQEIERCKTMLSLIEMHHQAAGLLMNHIPSDLFLFESLHTSIMHVIEYMTSVPKNMCEATLWKTEGVTFKKSGLVDINEAIKEQIELRMNALGKSLSALNKP
ncbi:hypothetical protein G6F70_002848 [Rhizopus microsporus]|uniref:Uncharacterized protein n=1 Tax=Rhizopus azygosporus TaxID=86630 RepID=A0A367J9Y2_RHIAZ|nr:hypothetical protein G6F71_002782 [Rhizopus microsporus]RCH86639.1 hypothetical protein CU097_010278 [Rhizopus azygosporus]KAG1201798.1 hypothetical protein G6F70_002848 [Rhizopus microsporus]KAG1207840.1 hypothetical protein G6F69_007717 [Rhizopus microsporus]KAG1228808.1 hypothetical protein G6F67_007581 [Rhizopus microsporus]